MLARIKVVFSDHIRHHFGPEIRSDELSDTIELMWYRGGREALDLGGEFQEHADRIIRFFMFVAHAVRALDNVPDEAIRQIEASSFNMEAIRTMHLDLLRGDHVYVADQFVTRVVRGQGFGHRLAELVRISIGRIALKECRRDLDWVRKQSGTKINHIADWLASAVANEAPWLSNVDERGRAKKLLKFGSLDAMHAEAEKHMKRKLAAEAAAIMAEEETFADDGGEYRIVRLTTPASLDRESDAMRHCVGHGAYDRYLALDDYLLLSLRDKANRPHVTIQVNHGAIVQFFGKANTKPKPEYRAAALRLLEPFGFVFPSKSDGDHRHMIDYGPPIEFPEGNLRDRLWLGPGL
ncbi:hypothetical protein HFO56_22990 [Rhizobium laguerreae]|uniref:PcfJ domain-containing protein n=1 Tax=Rhizobium laguerreae TaxID=1076926 RepID=UPI001C91C1CC|nr:PcfJ domain-containing protein [Rhizobium laguerreae]MBY3155191.1 hypothetical protein [Rhizobium laguerreae]